MASRHRLYDPDASVYTSVPTSTSPRPHPDPDVDSSADEAERDVLEADMEVLHEEEEREKLLSGGDGLFGSIGRKVGNGSIKIGKKVKGMGRRKNVSEVVEMMGGKRLGMEEGGEFGIGDGEDSESELEEDGLLAEKLAFERKVRTGSSFPGDAVGVFSIPHHSAAEYADHRTFQPRKPTPRLCGSITVVLLAFLLLLIFASLNLSSHRLYSTPAPQAPTLSNGTHAYRPTTLLISLDGFRADFLTRNLSPTLSAFVASGLSPRFMTPSFPSVTFPNHWTLATGLYPESHGIVGNTFWDPNLKKEFYYTDPARSLGKEWWGGEPIWATAERQGMKSAVHMWPGLEVTNGWGASYVDHYNGSEQLERKTARILEWLDMPLSERPQFIAAYVPNIDVVGHKFGPNTTETNDEIKAVDRMIGDLLAGLEQRNITDLINIVIVSDHGMASTSNDRLIYLDDIIDMSLIEHTDGWPLYGLRPHSQVNLAELHATLKAEVAINVGKGQSHWNVYLRDEDMPERWHFSNNERIAPLWIIPDTGYAIVTHKEFDLKTIQPGEKYHPAGLHGYDNAHPLMRAMFVARGPAFSHLHGNGKAWIAMDDHSAEESDVRSGVVEEFANTEVYRILCETLGLMEAAGGNNATIADLYSFTLIEETENTGSDTTDDKNEEEEYQEDTSEDGDEDDDESISSTATLESTTPVPSNSPTTASSNAPTTVSIGIHTLTSSQLPSAVPTEAPSTDSTEEEDSPANKSALDWLEFVRMKAEKLKDALDKWWIGVWTDGGERK